MRRISLLVVWFVALLVLVAACADGFAPRGDDDDEKFDEGASGSSQTTPSPDLSAPPAAAVPTPAPTPTATPRPTATPQATATVQPTATATPTVTPTPTATPTPMFPPQLIGEEIRVLVGESASQTIATDSDGTIVDVRILEADDDVRVLDDMTLEFSPTDAGRTRARVEVTDSQGLRARGSVVLIARYPGHPQALVGMGDSVPSGHGLDVGDYLGGDPCWRSDDSYPRRVFNALNTAGYFPAGRGEFALLACSGYDVDDLYEREVTGGFSDISPDDGKRTQLDWAVRSNPRFVTLTIGANDTGFVGPDQLFLADGVTLDRPQVDRRLAVIERDLRTVIDRLVDATDATVFVSNYYNPVAENPQGIPTCRTDCFLDAANEVIDGMNDVIETVARSYPRSRVVLVDFETPFAGKGAPNGYGPDGLREGGFGPLGDLIAGQVEDVHPYCARGETVGSSWISPADCVHPDNRGTSELAQIMVDAITDHLGEYPAA